MIRTFRKHKNLPGDWHFHPECSHWPKADYIEEEMAPSPDELCLECMTRYIEERPRPGRRRRAST